MVPISAFYQSALVNAFTFIANISVTTLKVSLAFREREHTTLSFITICAFQKITFISALPIEANFVALAFFFALINILLNTDSILTLLVVSASDSVAWVTHRDALSFFALKACTAFNGCTPVQTLSIVTKLKIFANNIRNLRARRFIVKSIVPIDTDLAGSSKSLLISVSVNSTKVQVRSFYVDNIRTFPFAWSLLAFDLFWNNIWTSRLGLDGLALSSI